MARTPSRASWRRGGGRKEPVTGQGSSGIVSGVSEASATEQPGGNVEPIEVDGRPFYVNPGKGAR